MCKRETLTIKNQNEIMKKHENVKQEHNHKLHEQHLSNKIRSVGQR